MKDLSKVIEARKSYNVDRAVLVDTIKRQYESLGISCDVADQLLDPGHFTVVTAHQPTLLTGPLYFIYKICSAINLARKLNERYPEVVVHPLFITGGEDHDFEEMNHLRFFGKEFVWTNDQSGSVGRMTLDGLQPIIDEICEVLGSGPHAERLINLIRKCFDGSKTYGASTQEFVIHLFENTELIVIQMDEPALKAQFNPVIKDELLHQTSSTYISNAQQSVERLGYKPQAYVRDINLFYLDDQMRNRIEKTDGGYQVVDTDLHFSDEEMLGLVESNPEKFSPNVNLRPLFQEMVLPNLAYIGGGGELAYWLERKSQFEHFGVPFPILVRRNSVLYINKGNHKQREKLELTCERLFQDPEHEISEWVRAHSTQEVDLSAEISALAETLGAIVDKANAVEPSFARKVEAFKVKTLKEVEHTEKRLVREEKAKLDTSVSRIRKLYGKLFPEGKLQERFENFMPMYLSSGDQLFELLIEHLDPLEPGFIVIEEM